MNRINQPDAPGGRFTDGDAGSGTPGTSVRAAHMNAVQDELLNVITAAGLDPSDSDLTQLSQAISRLSVSTGGLTNRIINGTMQVWQRGTSFDVTPTPEYTADRWEIQSDGAGGAGLGTVTRGLQGQQQGTVVGLFDYLRYTPTVASDQGGPAIRQKIEALSELSDRAIAVSFVARVSTPTQFVVTVTQRGYGLNRIVREETIDVGDSWERHSFTFNSASLPSANPAGSTPHLEVSIRVPGLALGIVDLARVQVEEGAVATTFEERHALLEELLCRRYFQSSYPRGAAPGLAGPGSVAVLANDATVEVFRSFRLTPEMRGLPTVRWYLPDGTPGQILWDGTPRTVSGSSGNTTASLGIPFVAGGYPSVLSKVIGHYTADAEI